MTRENAILCLKGIKNYGRDTFTEQSDWQESLDMAIKALEHEPKTGHWIDTDEGFSPCECSECKLIEFKKSKYCPNCGAKMAESEE